MLWLAFRVSWIVVDSICTCLQLQLPKGSHSSKPLMTCRPVHAYCTCRVCGAWQLIVTRLDMWLEKAERKQQRDRTAKQTCYTVPRNSLGCPARHCLCVCSGAAVLYGKRTTHGNVCTTEGAGDGWQGKTCQTCYALLSSNRHADTFPAVRCNP